jgi:hypothetical protein
MHASDPQFGGTNFTQTVPTLGTRSIEKRVRGSTVEKCGDRPCLLGEEGERAEEEEHEQHAGVLEVDEAVRADPGAAGEDAAAELQAHVQERAAGHQVELQQAGPLGEGVPRADAERRRVGGEARDAGPHPPQAHRQEQRPRQDVAVERPHFGARRRAARLGSARWVAGSRRSGGRVARLLSINQSEAMCCPVAVGLRRPSPGGGEGIEGRSRSARNREEVDLGFSLDRKRQKLSLGDWSNPSMGTGQDRTP